MDDINKTTIFLLTKECRHSETIQVLDNVITIPKYIKRSLSKHRLELIGTELYLQRKCNNCGKFINIQKYDFTLEVFTNLKNCNMRFIGEKSGFHNQCIMCKPNKISRTYDYETQLNIHIPLKLKRYFQIRALENDTSLKFEICTILETFKNNN